MGLLMFIFAGLVALALVGLSGYTIYRLAPEENAQATVLAEWPWLVKGFGVPLAIWILMNVGLSLQLQPFMPSVQLAQNAGTGWFFAFLGVIGAGLLLIATYWAGVTIGWSVIRASRGIDGETRASFRALCLTCLVATALPAVWLLWVGGWYTLGLTLLLIGLPIAGYGPSILRRVKQRPMYSRAIARMKFGKYRDAENEIIRQLESAENDFDGWLMLGELYASQFKDIAEAEQIILEICDQPDVTPSQIAVALHKLADWQIAFASDPEAAARALQMISNRLPGTHLARMAELRRTQLPHNAAELRERREARPIPLPALSELADETGTAAKDAIDSDQAVALAQQLAQQLTLDPNDISAREKLARLFAESLGQADLAIEQIELLLDMADQPDGKRAEWLSLIAAWQLRHRHDATAARVILQRLIHEFPNTAQAFAAQRRLSLLNAEAARKC
jgi:Tetratricopeptide repeat